MERHTNIESTASSVTVTANNVIDEAGATALAPSPVQPPPVLHLRLEHPRPSNERRVAFHEGVIDNEHMNRKKSKCCCIYRKPVAFGESSSESDDECEHCFGHPEQRKKNREKHNHHEHNHDAPPADNVDMPPEAIATTTVAQPTPVPDESVIIAKASQETTTPN